MQAPAEEETKQQRGRKEGRNSCIRGRNGNVSTNHDDINADHGVVHSKTQTYNAVQKVLIIEKG